ncbi:hypothetical protein BC938DRAFT_472769, partial [Jimgerdemannia flammicorona]
MAEEERCDAERYADLDSEEEILFDMDEEEREEYLGISSSPNTCGTSSATTNQRRNANAVRWTIKTSAFATDTIKRSEVRVPRPVIRGAWCGHWLS